MNFSAGKGMVVNLFIAIIFLYVISHNVLSLFVHVSVD